MSDDSLDPFFGGHDDSTMAELISIFEEGDEDRLSEFLKSVPDEATRRQLVKGLEQIRQAKREQEDE